VPQLIMNAPVNTPTVLQVDHSLLSPPAAAYLTSKDVIFRAQSSGFPGDDEGRVCSLRWRVLLQSGFARARTKAIVLGPIVMPRNRTIKGSAFFVHVYVVQGMSSESNIQRAWADL